MISDVMGIEERVAALEARITALESGATGTSGTSGTSGAYEGDFWALDGWKERLAGADAADGGVLFTGAVRLPTGERYEWQTGALTEDVLEDDGPVEALAALGHPVRLRLLRALFTAQALASVVVEPPYPYAVGRLPFLAAVPLGTGLSVAALAYLLLVESAARAVAGPRRVTGNHLVLGLGDGTHAVYAHLRRGSLRVRPGDRVTAGQPLAACGNSGNSTEPHVHFQLMDGPDLDTASGVPFTRRGVGVPPNGGTFTVPALVSVPIWGQA